MADEDLAQQQRREAFGRALTFVLSMKGMTQSDLSKKLGGRVAQSTISEWKRGQSEPASPAVTFEVEQVLEVEPGYLSMHLGYIPASAAGSLETALLRADEVDENWRQVLLNILREIRRQTAD